MFNLNNSNTINGTSNVSSLVIASLKRKMEDTRAKGERIPQSLRLQILQATAHMSCGQVAELLHLNKSTVSRWRSGVAKGCKKEKESATPSSNAAVASATPTHATVAYSKNMVAISATVLQRWLSSLFSSLLIVASTLLLVTEARLFYAQDSNGSLALLKAIILEVAVIYLSFLRTSSNQAKVAKGILLAILISYSAYTVSGYMVTSTYSQKGQERSLLRDIGVLTKELELKEQKIQLNLSKDRITTAMKLEKDKNEILSQLAKLKDQQRELAPKIINDSNVYSLIVFRIILLFINVFFTHHLRNLYYRPSPSLAYA